MRYIERRVTSGVGGRQGAAGEISAFSVYRQLVAMGTFSARVIGFSKLKSTCAPTVRRFEFSNKSPAARCKVAIGAVKTRRRRASLARGLGVNLRLSATSSPLCRAYNKYKRASVLQFVCGGVARRRRRASCRQRQKDFRAIRLRALPMTQIFIYTSLCRHFACSPPRDALRRRPTPRTQPG